MRRRLESLGIALFKTEIKRSVAFSEAAEKGITVAEVVDYRQRSAWYHYERVGNEIRDLLRLELAA